MIAKKDEGHMELLLYSIKKMWQGHLSGLSRHDNDGKNSQLACSHTKVDSYKSGSL